MHPSTTSLHPTTTATADHQLTNRLLLDFLIILTSLIPIAIFEFAIEPAKRGFFCNDETLMYPFRDNTVTTVMLGLLVGLLPTLIFVGVEFVHYQQKCKQQQNVEYLLLYGWKVPTFLIACIREFFYFCFGASITFNATEVGKYTIGRLRPHFISVCQPQLLDGSTCSDIQNQQRYIEHYVCMGSGFTIDDVRQSRLSFPSGHASLSFYAMIYCAFYIYYKFKWNGSKLLRHFIAFILIMLAWFVALSRVMDHWHHWSDVLIGAAIGVIGGFYTVFMITSMGKNTIEKYHIKAGISRQNTTTTLNEVLTTNANANANATAAGTTTITTTPPPYIVNSYSSEQYCTKV